MSASFVRGEFSYEYVFDPRHKVAGQAGGPVLKIRGWALSNTGLKGVLGQLVDLEYLKTESFGIPSTLATGQEVLPDGVDRETFNRQGHPFSIDVPLGPGKYRLSLYVVNDDDVTAILGPEELDLAPEYQATILAGAPRYTWGVKLPSGVDATPYLITPEGGILANDTVWLVWHNPDPNNLALTFTVEVRCGTRPEAHVDHEIWESEPWDPSRPFFFRATGIRSPNQGTVRVRIPTMPGEVFTWQVIADFGLGSLRDIASPIFEYYPWPMPTKNVFGGYLDVPRPDKNATQYGAAMVSGWVVGTPDRMTLTWRDYQTSYGEPLPFPVEALMPRGDVAGYYFPEESDESNRMSKDADSAETNQAAWDKAPKVSFNLKADTSEPGMGLAAEVRATRGSETKLLGTFFIVGAGRPLPPASTYLNPVATEQWLKANPPRVLSPIGRIPATGLAHIRWTEPADWGATHIQIEDKTDPKAKAPVPRGFIDLLGRDPEDRWYFENIVLDGIVSLPVVGGHVYEVKVRQVVGANKTVWGPWSRTRRFRVQETPYQNAYEEGPTGTFGSTSQLKTAALLAGTGIVLASLKS